MDVHSSRHPVARLAIGFRVQGFGFRVVLSRTNWLKSEFMALSLLAPVFGSPFKSPSLRFLCTVTILRDPLVLKIASFEQIA